MAECLSENDVSELVEGSMPAERMAEVDRHLDACAACRGLVAQVVRGIDALAPTAGPASYALSALTGQQVDRGGDSGLRVGQRLGPYRIIRQLGQGGMGVVFEALHEQLQRRAAIKILHLDHSARPELVRRFVNEARAANLVGHPSIVAIYEIGQLDSGAPFIVMEHLQGESLRERMGRIGPRLGLAALRPCGQIASALAAAHGKDIIHRDLKPDNVMLVPDPVAPGGERVKILDFGLAKLALGLGDPQAPALATRSGMLMGTPRYMAPEQCRAASKVDGKADVYSLGVMLYELLSGQPPFASPDAAELIAMHLRDAPPPLRAAAPEVDAALAALVDAMLAKDPAARPGMAQVAERLERAAHDSAASQPSGLAAALIAAPRARPAVLPLGGGLLVSAVALGLWASLSHLSPWRSRDGMVPIPGGTFQMGSTPDEIRAARDWCGRLVGEHCPSKQFDREQPRRQVRVSPFLLDETEVTNAAFAAWLNGRPGLRLKDDTMIWDGGTFLVNIYPTLEGSGLLYENGRFRARPGVERRPASQLSWDAALAYCHDHGGRLPTEAEWEYAARGARGHRFPWGDDAPGCQGVVFGRTRDEACAHLDAGPADVGTAPKDRSPQGVLDLGGNVAEWVMDRFLETYPACPGGCVDPVNDPAEGATPDLRVNRGGDWFDTVAMTRAAWRSRWPRDGESSNIGFRCAAAARR